MENDFKTKMMNGREETFPTLVLETWVVVSENQHKTQEMQGGNEGKFKFDVTNDIKAKMSEAID